MILQDKWSYLKLEEVNPNLACSKGDDNMREVKSNRAWREECESMREQLAQCQAALVAKDEALAWYQDEAEAISRNLRQRKDTAILASVQVLGLDNGTRASKALAIKSSDMLHQQLAQYQAALVEKDIALEIANIGMCAVGVPHQGERKVLQDAVDHIRKTLAIHPSDAELRKLIAKHMTVACSIRIGYEAIEYIKSIEDGSAAL